LVGVVLGLSPLAATATVLTGTTGGGQPYTTLQPSLEVNYIVRTSGDASQLGTIGMLANNFAPLGWAKADGSLLNIADNPALFGVLSNTYGGDGATTFALPDLRGRVPIGAGTGPGLTPRALGDAVGSELVTLTTDNLPAHDHTLPPSSDSTGMTGGDVPFSNMQPSLALNYTINVLGDFPPEFGVTPANVPILAFMGLTANSVLSDGTAPADGQIIPLFSNIALFSLLGTNFGGDGVDDFALPDLRGRAVIGEGAGAGLTPISLAASSGFESVALTEAELPEHDHSLPPSSDLTGSTGTGQPFDNMQPSLGLSFLIATEGNFPSAFQDPLDPDMPFIGEIALFAGNFIPVGWLPANGQILNIIGNQALFALMGSQYGGDGAVDFALPDLRGRFAVGLGQGPGLSNWFHGRSDGVETVGLTVAQMSAHDHTVGEATVTEPSTLGAFMLALLGLGIMTRRRTADSKWRR
jgi:microcystin-dependent protein